MLRPRILWVAVLILLAAIGPAAARGGGGGGSSGGHHVEAASQGPASIHSSVIYHPNQGWTVATPITTVRDHRSGNNPGGGVTITTGTPPNGNLHHGGIKDPPSRWRGEGIVRDHRSSSTGLR